MSDPAFVAASYAIVLGGLAAYAASIARRTRAARRMAQSIERERERGLPAKAGEAAGTVPGRAPEAL